MGRGEGSKGKTAGRGTKGTKARYQVPGVLRGRPDAAAHEDAEAARVQEPVPRRVPGGQHRPPGRALPDGGEVTVADPSPKGAVRDSLVKVLGTGDLAVALHVTADKVSAAAKEKIEAAGGVTLVD